MIVRSDTIKPLFPALYWWRVLGVLPFSHISVQNVTITTSSVFHTLGIVIVISASSFHFGYASYILLEGRTINFVQVTGMISGFLLVSCVLFFSSTSCTFLQTRCLGLLPYSKVEGSGAKIRLRQSRLIHVLGLGGIASLSLAAGVCLSENVFQIVGNIHSPSISADITEFLLKCFSIVIAVTIVVFTKGSCDLLTKYLRYLVKVDTALLTTPGNPHRGLMHVLLSGVVWLARAAITVWLFQMPLCDILLFPLWFVILAAEQLTVVLCQELARRYRAINSALQGMRPSRNNKHPDTAQSMKFEELRADKLLEAKLAWLEPSIIKQDSPTTLTPARVELLREAHSSLADAFQELNNKLGVFLLIDLAYLFIVLLSTSINFLQHCIIQSNDDRGDTNFCVGYAVLAMDGLVRMGIITVSCGAVGEEAERTAEAAARLLRRALDWDALRELQILGAQVRARRVAFWACGLFTVDRPLLFSICGAVTSYLFILSQLK